MNSKSQSSPVEIHISDSPSSSSSSPPFSLHGQVPTLNVLRNCTCWLFVRALSPAAPRCLLSSPDMQSGYLMVTKYPECLLIQEHSVASDVRPPYKHSACFRYRIQVLVGVLTKMSGRC